MMSGNHPSHFFLDKDQDGAIHLKWNSPAGGDHPSPNWLDQNSLNELEGLLDQLLDGPRPALVILSSGNNRGFGTGFTSQYLATCGSNELLLAAGSLQRCCQKLTQIPCPIIAAVSGLCLDEGLELALFCDYRIVFDSPKTRVGFRSQERQWYPTPGSIPRICELLGLERGFKLTAHGQLLQAKTALRWGLADSAPTNEHELRREIGLLKGKALGRGKIAKPMPQNWIRRFLQLNPIGRKWVAKGLTRWLDRALHQESPWTGYLVSALQDCTAGSPSSDTIASRMWKVAANHPLSLKSLIFCSAFAHWNDGQTRQKTEIIRGVLCDYPEIPAHPFLGILHGKSVRIQSTNHDAPCPELRIEGLSTWKPVVSRPEKSSGDMEGPTKIRLTWDQASNRPEQAYLWGPFKQGPQLYAALENPLEACPKLQPVLAGLGIRATVHSNPRDSWVSLLFTMIESSLAVLAQNLDAGLFEQEARKKGWLDGPCWWMQSNDILFLCNSIQTWNAPSNVDEKQASGLEFSRRFANWIANLELAGISNSKNDTKGLWVRRDKSGMFHASRTGRKWPVFAQAEPDLAFKSLPEKQRHVEAVNRIEKALVTGWQKLPPRNRQQASFVFFHGLLGFPGWKIASLSKELPDFSGDGLRD
ncbi:MAG: enoyl-CoA hydratase/isomerase family protein [Gemmataceae bacterium]